MNTEIRTEMKRLIRGRLSKMHAAMLENADKIVDSGTLDNLGRVDHVCMVAPKAVQAALLEVEMGQIMQHCQGLYQTVEPQFMQHCEGLYRTVKLATVKLASSKALPY
jgi:hypothetical protein